MNTTPDDRSPAVAGPVDWPVRRWWKLLRQKWCAHVCRLEDMRRVSQARVECVCLKCNAELSAPFGLALPCRWVDYSKWISKRGRAR